MVEFDNIPDNLLTPFVAIEFDSRFAAQGPAIQPYRALLIGQRLSTGSVAELEPKLIASRSQARDFWGAGSQMERMAAAYFRQTEAVELWGIALDDDGAAVQSTGTFTISGSPSEAGTLFAYVAGERYDVGIASTDTADSIGDALAAAINADDSAPVTAANVTGTVTVTAKNGGTMGDDIDLRVNYREGEETPDGLTVAVAAMSGGATDPDVSTVWPALGDDQYHVIASALNDTANLDALKSELDDRWGPLAQNEGHAFVGWRGTQAGAVSLGSGRNNKHETIIAADASPTTPWEWAAAVLGVVSQNGQADPGRPFQGRELKGVLAPLTSKRWDQSERNVLLDNGIATFTVGVDGTVRVERLVTTYQQNAQGADDPAFRDVNVLLTLSYLRFDLRTHLLLRFPNSKLGQDGQRYAAGSNVVTPKSMRAEIISKFREWEQDLALVEDLDQFKRDLVVERDSQDPNRLNVLVPPNLINQLRVTAASIQFRL